MTIEGVVVGVVRHDVKLAIGFYSRMELDDLLRNASVWKGRSRYELSHIKGLSTGIEELDEALPGQGWPLGSVIEIIVERYGLGELTLLMPALVELTNQSKENNRGWILWVAPPFIPYAPALTDHGLDLSNLLLVHPQNTAGFDHHDALWAVEHSFKVGFLSGCFGLGKAGR